ncbi:MAG: Crp/Fnr family transcriptional regulator [Prochlorothrix sp.]|nr:Crp/Fnr family transcriptional regulator [Prochlorothrix sp.]
MDCPDRALLQHLVEVCFLFRGLPVDTLVQAWGDAPAALEKLYSNRPVFTAFRPGEPLDSLYTVLGGGPVIIRSAPLDRIIAITYTGGCFGMRSLPLSYGLIFKAFPSQVEAYKTTDVLRIPLTVVSHLYETQGDFRDRYHLLFELREKFQYHLLNCSAYPPQAVASLLRALIYQERALGHQPDAQGIYRFDLPVDLIARASQLNQRTVEQVLKGMQQVGLTQAAPEVTPGVDRSAGDRPSSDSLYVADPEGMKEVYSATRDKVAWWPLR